MVSYSFASSWVTPAAVDRVADVVTDLEQYPQWWPQILAVASLGPDTGRVLLRSSLPITLDVVLESVCDRPPVLEVAVGGDIDGWVRWALTPVDGGTRCDYTQEVTVSGPLAWMSYVARPLLAWNHARAMAGCRSGLDRRVRQLGAAPLRSEE